MQIIIMFMLYLHDNQTNFSSLIYAHRQKGI